MMGGERKSCCKPVYNRFLEELNRGKPRTLDRVSLIWYNISKMCIILCYHNFYDLYKYIVCTLIYLLCYAI